MRPRVRVRARGRRRMTTINLLLPTSADDLAAALYDRAGHADPRWRAPVVRRLAQELRSNPDHAVPVGTVPAFAPAWASAGPVHHLLPGRRVHRQVAMVVAALERATELPRDLQRRNSTLAGQCAALPAAFEHERWPALVARSQTLLAALERWAEAEGRRREQARPLRPAATAPALSGRRWRRARTIGELLAHSGVARWCILDGGRVADDYFDRFATGDLTFWTLHDADGAPRALLSHTEDGAVEEVRTAANDPASVYRADILRLVRAGFVNLEWPSADVDALAVDPHLGRRGQRHAEGVLTGRHCLQPIRYRLWTDGRRRRYLLATGTDAKRTRKTYLRLDASPKSPRRAELHGGAEPAWTGLPSALMNAALADAFPKAGRPAHVARAMRIARGT